LRASAACCEPQRATTFCASKPSCIVLKVNASHGLSKTHLLLRLDQRSYLLRLQGNESRAGIVPSCLPSLRQRICSVSVSLRDPDSVDQFPTSVGVRCSRFPYSAFTRSIVLRACTILLQSRLFWCRPTAP
jgi:hypothetical protein